MTELGEAFIPIRATMDKLDADLAQAKSKISGAMDNLGKVGGVALTAGFAAASAAVAGLGVALGFSIAQALDAERGQARLAQVIQSTGGAAGLTQERANELAQEFMHLASGSDDAILAIEEIGLRSGTISSEQMPAFIQATLDLGAVMGDTGAAATLLARAQEDPIAAMGRMQRSGIIFSDTLKDQIALLVKNNDMAGATALIMDRVAEATGGAAASNAGTLSGQWATMKGTMGEAAETIGAALLPPLRDLFDNVIAPAIPIVTGIASALGGLITDIVAGGDISKSFSQFSDAFEEWPAIQEFIAKMGVVLENIGTVITDTIIPAIQEFIAQATPIVEAIVGWLEENVKLQDVLIALGIAIGIFIITAIAPLIASMAPIILTFIAIVAVVALLRTAWEQNLGGIQEKTAEVWGIIQPLLAQAQTWLGVNLPLAIEALRAFWVDTAWPAIQSAIEFVWPIILAIFDAWQAYIVNVTIPVIKALVAFWVETAWPAIQRAIEIVWPVIETIFKAVKDFIINTLIPTIKDLYTKWTTIWWPTIQRVLENVWAIIEGVFKEVDRWINKNIVPWIEFLQKKWAEEVWPAIQKALEDAWAIIKPIWEALQEWLEETLPPAVEGLKKAFEPAMTAIIAAIQPLKDLWDAFTKAVSDFWTWITSHTFSFSLSIPDLPDWAVPGSPLPIHAAWKNFAEDMGRMNITPSFDLDAIAPVMGLLDNEGESDRSVHYSSVTTVHTNRDPMRVLRASRHLDKLGMAAA